MPDTDASIDAERDALRDERDALLDELATAYRHLEQSLGSRQHETELAYQELRKRNQELQQRFAELQRTHEILRETQGLLLRSERLSAMGQMAAAVVHEINNPLAAIAGRVDLLLMRQDASHRQELERIQDATHALRDLTRNILRFSRRRNGEDGAPAALDVNASAREVLSFFGPLIKHVELEEQLEADLPAARGVSAQVEQVLTNLLVNAVDALEDWHDRRLVVRSGCGTLADLQGAEQRRDRTARLALPAAAEDLLVTGVWVAVEDRGPGISDDDLEQVFEAFFTTKGEDRGTGLGLAISRSIAESLGGNLLVSSAAGHGARFLLFLQPAESPT